MYTRGYPRVYDGSIYIHVLHFHLSNHECATNPLLLSARCLRWQTVLRVASLECECTSVADSRGCRSPSAISSKGQWRWKVKESIPTPLQMHFSPVDHYIQMVDHNTPDCTSCRLVGAGGCFAGAVYAMYERSKLPSNSKNRIWLSVIGVGTFLHYNTIKMVVQAVLCTQSIYLEGLLRSNQCTRRLQLLITNFTSRRHSVIQMHLVHLWYVIKDGYADLEPFWVKVRAIICMYTAILT